MPLKTKNCYKCQGNFAYLININGSLICYSCYHFRKNAK